MFVCVDYLSVGNKTEFYKRLETVAYTAHKTVALFEKLRYVLFNCRVAEECGYKLAASVGLVAAGETAGNKDYL